MVMLLPQKAGDPLPSRGRGGTDQSGGIYTGNGANTVNEFVRKKRFVAQEVFVTSFRDADIHGQDIFCWNTKAGVSKALESS